MDCSKKVASLARRCGALTVLVFASAIGASAAPVPVYESNIPLISPPAFAPQIDAYTWVNRSLFDLTVVAGPLPFETRNTYRFTNTPSGRLVVDPGIRFFRNTNGFRYPMDHWVNEGTIVTDHISTLLDVIFGDSSASILHVVATNITSRGLLSSGAHGLVRLEGRNVTVPRTGIRTGPGEITASLPSFIGSQLYVNDYGIFDRHYGLGTNNSVLPGRPPMQLDGFELPFPVSPIHQVFAPFLTSYRVPIARFLTNEWQAAVFTNSITRTSSVVQVVFYPANVDPSQTVEVRFLETGSGAAEVYVAFRAMDIDIATQSPTTNSIFLTDILGTTTNLFYSANFLQPTFRPSTLEVTRSEPFLFFLAETSSVPFVPELINGPQYTRMTVTNLYAGYSATIGTPLFTGSVPYDITNVPGRVDIIGDNVNLERTRIRSENAIVINVTNLVGSRLPSLDAPQLVFDGRSTQSTMLITNFSPATVKRFNGRIDVWSSRWDNNAASGTNTNTVTLHVLIVDPHLESTIPVDVSRFTVRATNIVLSDAITIGKAVKFEGESLYVSGSGRLRTPFTYSLGASNLVGIRHFTNDGTVIIGGGENMGVDRPEPYSNYVNRGTNAAFAHQIRTLNLENPGYIRAAGGPLNIDTLILDMRGRPFEAVTNVETITYFDSVLEEYITVEVTNVNVTTRSATLESISDVRIDTRDMLSSNGWINAGTLILSVTNDLTDAGPSALSYWNVTNGFHASILPATNQLLGTYLRTFIPRLRHSDHSWAGMDLGAVAAGYSNNLAVGKLTLDAEQGPFFSFSAPTGPSAIYVDYLEFLNFATNYDSVLSIDPNFTIYFADSNIPAETLDGALEGRIRWVPDFAGPISGLMLPYGNGQSYAINGALARSQTIDSDGDGIPNAYDSEPIYVSENAALTVELAAAPRRAVLNWQALARATNTIEFKLSASEGPWSVLTNFVHGPVTSPVSVTDLVPTIDGSRLYRLKVEPHRP